MNKEQKKQHITFQDLGKLVSYLGSAIDATGWASHDLVEQFGMSEGQVSEMLSLIQKLTGGYPGLIFDAKEMAAAIEEKLQIPRDLL